MKQAPDLRYEENPREIPVECGSDWGQDIACSVNGWVMPQGTLQVQRAVKQMGWPEVFQWVTDELRFEEEFLPFSSSHFAQVHAITGQEGEKVTQIYKSSNFKG